MREHSSLPVSGPFFSPNSPSPREKYKKQLIFADCQYNKEGILKDHQKFIYEESTGLIKWAYTIGKTKGKKGNKIVDERCISKGKSDGISLDVCDVNSNKQLWWFDNGFIRPRNVDLMNYCLIVYPYEDSLEGVLFKNEVKDGNRKKYWIDLVPCQMHSFGVAL